MQTWLCPSIEDSTTSFVDSNVSAIDDVKGTCCPQRKDENDYIIWLLTEEDQTLFKFSHGYVIFILLYAESHATVKAEDDRRHIEISVLYDGWKS